MRPSREDQKSLLRQKLRFSLKALKASDRRVRNQRIYSKVVSSDIFRQASSLFAYMALPEEVQTKRIILRALREGKKVYVPHVNEKRKTMSIYQIKDLERDVKIGTYGILEPKRYQGRRGKVSDVEVALIPGLGFDAKGRRLGRGQGYFDRFLVKLKKCPKIGLAFREQIIKRIPVQSWDQGVDQVISDK